MSPVVKEAKVVASNRPSAGSRAQSVQWLRDLEWPEPGWYEDEHRAGSWVRYFTYQLRSRYTELEHDFRSVTFNFLDSPSFDVPSARQAAELLGLARKTLQLQRPSLLLAANTLALVERLMVWLLPPQLAIRRAQSIHWALQRHTAPVAAHFAGQLRTMVDSVTEQELWSDPYRFGALRGLMDQALAYINREDIDARIGTGLYIDRLRRLRNWGAVMLAAVVIGAVLMLSTEGLAQWQPATLVALLGDSPITVVASVLVIAVTGAAGGFLSGLLHARDSSVGLADFQASMLKLQLRPLVGALVAVVLYVFLTWQILPGLSIQSAGNYLLIAFVAGFSERYFLQLVRAEEGFTRDDGPSPVRGAIPPATADLSPRDSQTDGRG